MVYYPPISIHEHERIRLFRAIAYFVILFGLILSQGCSKRGSGRIVNMVVTAYCPCKKCCGWKRNWFGRPVYAYGKSKGLPKKIGVCADGTKAIKGTIAADTRYYRFDTKMYIPGYGYGTVHDRGGEIKGKNRIDIFFKTHKQALEWGRQKKRVYIKENQWFKE